MSHQEHLRELVAEVAAAYFLNSHVTAAEIPRVISQIASSLEALPSRGGLEKPDKDDDAYVPERKMMPATRVRDSITYDSLVSFEDSKPYKNLRPHLAARGLTPEAYRFKWGLPPTYPMVAASYSEARSKIAKSMKLGSRGLAARKQARARVSAARAK